MSLSATLFGRDSAIFKATNILGLGIPGWLDKKFGPPETEGPRLSDLSVQTSTYGAPLARLYGTIAVMGNVIWIENNRLKETVRKNESSGGKGGGGSAEPTTTYSYSATFHLALCEGEIDGVRRIWCGDKLIYNAGSNDVDTIIASNRSAKGFRVYRGTDNQMPDSRYEADVGASNASAHRGMAYIAFYDLQLAEYSNTLQAAQFKVEVLKNQVPPGFRYVTRVESGIDYGAIGGRPYIHEAADGFIRATSDSQVDDYLYRSSGAGSYNGTTTMYLSPPTGSTSSDVFTVARRQNADRVLFTGFDSVYQASDIYILDQTDLLVGTIDLDPIDAADAYTMKLNGLTSNTDCTIFLASFCEASKSASSFDIDKWYLFDDAGQVIRQGGPVVSFNSQLSLAFGRSTQGFFYNYFVSCLSSDGNYLYSAHGAIGQDFKVFSTEDMSVIESIPGALSIAGAFVQPSIAEINGIIYVVAGSYFWAWTDTGGVSPDVLYLSDVIESEVDLSELISQSDIDTSLLDSEVRGYRVTSGSIRSALEPLQTAFPFDVRQHGYTIQFVPRGQESIAEIPWEDLGAGESGAQDELLSQSREMDSQLPARTTIQYLDAAREYAISVQYSERLNTEAVNRVDRELPIVLNANEASGMAEVLNFLPWLERTDAVFVLPPPYRYLEPGDVVTVEAPSAVYEFRLTEVNEAQDGRIECQAKPNRAALYQSGATGSEGVPPSGEIGLGGRSLFLPLDIPVVDESLQNSPGFVGVMTGYTETWPGGLSLRSNDNGQTWFDLQAFTGFASIGFASDVLPASDCTLIDQRSITVGMVSGVPESLSRDQMLSGMNYAAYGVDGRWEIVRFQNATLQADGSYLISHFIRGEKGTEWASGLHAIGDYFVLLEDADNAFIGSPIESIALPRLYRGVTAGEALDTASNIEFTYQGVNLECLSPVYAGGVRDGSSNFTGSFTRRSRLGSSWWATGVVAPVGEAAESYEIDVMDGSDVVRTIAVSTPTFSYSAANQTADFGAPQSSITFNIYQLSEIVGRGYPLEVTL